ncbi:MAG: hypothetical protein AAGA58_08940 [Verrucomicrobiota bacterium]
MPVLAIVVVLSCQFWLGVPFSRPIDIDPDWVKGREGHAVLMTIPKRVEPRPSQYPLIWVTENGKRLPIQMKSRSKVSKLGEGRFRWRERFLMFTATDNSDPMANGKDYQIILPRQLSGAWLAGSLVAAVVIGILLSLQPKLRNALAQSFEFFRGKRPKGKVGWSSFLSFVCVIFFILWVSFVWLLPAARDFFANYEGEATLAWKTLTILVSGLVAYFSMKRNGRTGEFRLSSPAFLVMIALVVFVVRYPTFYFLEANPDESEWIAGAQTLLDDPRFWISVDGTTSGPMVIYPLLLISLIGAPINYFTVKVFGLLLWVMAIFFVFGALRRHYGDEVARVGILPLVFFVVVLTYSDFVAYNGEHMSFFLTAAALYMYSLVVPSNEGKKRTAFIFGFVLGLFPYTKLQAVPMALVITCFSVIPFLFKQDRRLVPLIAGGLAPTLIVFSYLIGISKLGVFWTSYIESNFIYAVTHTKVEATGGGLQQFAVFLFKWAEDTRYFFMVWFSLIAVAICFNLLNLKSLSRRSVTFMAVLVFAASVYAVFQPMRQFAHYQLLILVPAGFALASLILGSNGRQGRWSRTVFLLAAVALPFGLTLYNAPHEAMGTSRTQRMPFGVGSGKVSAEILRHAEKGQRMVVWGFVPRFHVETGLLQGTKVPHNFRQVQPNEQQDYFLQEYVDDMERTKAEIFVDADPAGAPPMEEPGLYFGRPHENYPILRDYVAANYEQVAEVDRIRIFVRKS